MFHCDFCDRITEPREKLTLITTEIRDKEYPAVTNYRGDVIGSAGEGFEIVRQKKACEKCAAWRESVVRKYSVPESGMRQAV